MKIALVNYRYFISGGPERYYFNIKNILESKGHKVIPFSIKSSRNIPNSYEHYFLSKVDDETYFAQYKKTPSTIFKSLIRLFYSFEAKRAFKNLLLNEKPDIVYIIQYHNKISPSIIDAAKELGIPVVHRISDFQYICVNALLYNEELGHCEKCLNGSKLNAVKYKCVMNSRIYSLIKIMAQKLNELLRITQKIDAFIVPSRFTISKLAEYGISEKKMYHIPTFFNFGLIPKGTKISYEPFALYIGRIEKEKGLETLIKAFEGTSFNLKIIGFSNNGYEDTLKNYLVGKNHNIEFLGKKDFVEIVPYLATCMFTIVPSEWYDNFPNTILESFAFKKAVVASNIGSLTELVQDEITGVLFETKNFISLNAKIEKLMSNKQLCIELGKNGFRFMESSCSQDMHYQKIVKIFNDLIAKNIKISLMSK